MNKKEVSEIKKLFTPAGCAITRICGCYVDAEKEKRTELKEAFLSLPEEEAFKYFNIFKGAMTGTLGKNLINMEIPLLVGLHPVHAHILEKFRVADQGLLVIHQRFIAAGGQSALHQLPVPVAHKALGLLHRDLPEPERRQG